MIGELAVNIGASGRSYPAELSGVRVAAAIKPACEATGLSGDIVFLAQRGDQLCVAIGDACGKGAPAARLADLVRPHLGELAMFAETPSELLAQLNHALAGQLNDDVFVTATVLLIDTQTGVVLCANAGHVPPVLVRNGKTSLVGAASGPPLGLIADATYSDEPLCFEQGDRLLLMTDGISETLEDDLVAMPRVRELAASNAPLEQLNDIILDAVARAATRTDDRALLALEFTRAAAGAVTPSFELPAQRAA